MFVYQQTWGYFNIFSNKSKEKKAKKDTELNGFKIEELNCPKLKQVSGL